MLFRSVDFMTIALRNQDTTIKLQIWDTPGLEKFNMKATVYFRGAEAIILIFDLTQKSTFDDLDGYIEIFAKSKMDGCIFALIGT